MTITTFPSGTGRLGQLVLVPVGQAQLDPTGTGKGQKRPLLVPWDIHTLEAFPCPGTISTPTMELVPVPLVTNFSHRIGLQGREKATFIAYQYVRAARPQKTS